MKFKLPHFTVLGFVLGLLVLTGGCALASNDPKRAEIAAVFEAIRNGDLSQTQSLRKFGAQIIDEIRPYLDDENEDVRREAVALLAAMEDPGAAAALVATLDDDNADIRERAANAVLDHRLRFGDVGAVDPGEAIVAASKKGELSGSAILLLGYSQVGVTVLQQATTGTRLIKTRDAGPAVSIGLAAQLALSRRGDKSARAHLESHFADADDNSLIFVLSNIGIIDSPTLLHALAAATLGNSSPTGLGVPSGAEPSRRVADEAVIAFVKRLSLKIDFDVEDMVRFKPEQIDTVKELIGESIPQ